MEKQEIQLVQQAKEQEIDLLEVFFTLWKKVWVLIIGLIAGAAAAALITLIFITPQYEATSVIYILSKTTSITSLADLQIGSSLAADFQIIATTREVLEPVMRDLGVEETYEDFVKTVEVTNPTNSHMLRITVTNPDPVLAASFSNALADQLKLQIAEVMSTDTPSTVERAVIPEKASSPNLLLNCVIGGLVVFVICAGIILVTHFMDDTIKDEDDVMRYLNLNTLAAIPLEHTENEKTKLSGVKRTRRPAQTQRR